MSFSHRKDWACPVCENHLGLLHVLRLYTKFDRAGRNRTSNQVRCPNCGSSTHYSRFRVGLAVAASLPIVLVTYLILFAAFGDITSHFDGAIVVCIFIALPLMALVLFSKVVSR